MRVGAPENFSRPRLRSAIYGPARAEFIEGRGAFGAPVHRDTRDRVASESRAGFGADWPDCCGIGKNASR